MLKKGLFLFILFFSFTHVAAEAQLTGARDEQNLRLLFHVHNGGVEQGWTPVAWAIAPAIDEDAEKWIGLAGARYDGKIDEKTNKPTWNLEVLAGALFAGDNETPLLDLRITPPKFSKRWSSWGNARVIDPFGEEKFYFYGMLDYAIPGFGKVGLESENLFKPGDDNLSIGPHVILPFGERVAMVVAHQFHSDGFADESWVRFKFTF